MVDATLLSQQVSECVEERFLPDECFTLLKLLWNESDACD